ncbi:hypothetical protein CEP51_002286 [Fusarium floridanum]|uniref:Gfo/Idh/MocA-like oxidoreductase N-terminal domain-containing protein n=1 Tax=Fusarium floridanum TaxID=1325733 RepID=A0A428SBX8_9HYPO|nr:hypothetical protein CEP51_002286 [Fusarium floridanum]
MAPIRVGLVGYRFSAKVFHLPYILPNPDFQIYAVLQRTAAPAPGEEFPGFGHCTVDFPDVKHYRTAEDFFADPKIELVIICTRVHQEFIERGLEAGKHVVVEKPFVTASDIADRLIQLANEKQKILTVFHNRRFDNDFRTLQYLMSKDALGDVMEAEIHFDVASAPWIKSWDRHEYKPGEGMAFGLGCHTIDQALLLFGRPESVTGFLRSTRGIESDIDDTFTIVLEYSGRHKNLVVTIKTAVVTHMKHQLKYLVRGTKGSYLKFGTDPQESQAIAAPGKPAIDDKFGVEDESLWGTLTTTDEFDASCQRFDEVSQLYIGQYPTLRGWYRGYYENVAKAIREL